MNKQNLINLWLSKGFSMKALKYQKVIAYQNNTYIFLNKKHGLLTYIKEL
jgi:hypothetical protein